MAALILAAYAELYPLELIEHKLYDARMELRRETAPPPVTLVLIDRESIKKFGPWPWPRAYIAFAIQRLHAYNARVIGTDILYAQRDLNPGLAEIRDVMKKIKNGPKLQRDNDLAGVIVALKEAEKKLDNDSALALSLSTAKNVVLPVSFTLGGRAAGDRHDMGKFFAGGPTAASGRDFFSARSITAPLPEFSANASGFGYINHIPDRDGTIRSEPLFISYAGRLFPSLAVQLIAEYLDRDMSAATFGKDVVRVGDVEIPTFKNHTLLISFAHGNSFPHYSFSDLATGKVPREMLTGRIVLLGLSAPEPGTSLRTPGGHAASNLDLTAAVIGTVLGKDFIVRPGWAFPLEAGVLVLSGILLAAVALRLRVSTGAAVAPALSLAWAAVSLFLFLEYGYWLKISYQLALMCLGYPVLLAGRYMFREQEPVEAELIESSELRLVVGVRTDTGLVRKHNEDNFCIEKSSGLLAVADGVGGQMSGEVASKMAIDTVRDFLRNAEASGEWLDNSNGGYSEATGRLGTAISAANRTIYEASQSNPRWQKMGTTIAAVALKQNRLSVAHVGDSRAYLVRSGHIEQLTDDHNLKEATMRHILLRALGTSPDVEVDLTELTLSKGDILVLCTDGLNTMVSDGDILSAVKSVQDPFKACTRLVHMANKRGGKDNITVIVAYAHKKK